MMTYNELKYRQSWKTTANATIALAHVRVIVLKRRTVREINMAVIITD